MDARVIDECDFQDRDRGVSLIDVSPFCDQLENFIKYITSVRDLNFLTYEYPNDLQNRLDTDVLELETLLAEVKEALINSERLKTQRKSIKNEKIAVKKILKRMRDDEVKEMECTISLYDKPMFSRWENVRTTQKPEVLEAMLADIKGKQLALENLTVLVTRKLGQIQVFQPQNTGEVNGDKNPLKMREKTVIPLPFPSFCTPIIPVPPPPPPPPLPVQLQAPVSHLPKRSHTQRLSIQRRRRLERRENNENFERRRSPNREELSLVPLTTLCDLPDNLARNIFPTILNPMGNSSHDVLSDNNGAASTSLRNTPNDVTLLNINEENHNSNEADGLGTEFQSEMRTVLQALFGDLRSAPTLLVTESTSSNVAEAENASNTNREIELYTLRKPE